MRAYWPPWVGWFFVVAQLRASLALSSCCRFNQTLEFCKPLMDIAAAEASFVCGFHNFLGCHFIPLVLIASTHMAIPRLAYFASSSPRSSRCSLQASTQAFRSAAAARASSNAENRRICASSIQCCPDVWLASVMISSLVMTCLTSENYHGSRSSASQAPAETPASSVAFRLRGKPWWS